MVVEVFRLMKCSWRFPKFYVESNGPVADCPCFAVIEPVWLFHQQRTVPLRLEAVSIPCLPLPGHRQGSCPEGCQVGVGGEGGRRCNSRSLPTVVTLVGGSCIG